MNLALPFVVHKFKIGNFTTYVILGPKTQHSTLTLVTRGVFFSFSIIDFNFTKGHSYKRQKSMRSEVNVFKVLVI